jgi:hypothetical protein
VRFKLVLCLPLAVVVISTEAPVWALDKQGSAHNGHVGGDAQETNVSGSSMLGAALYNPSYAARPDNTGHALLRYALHLDVDLLGRFLSIPIDVNLFTDRERHKARVFAPSELDLIGGLTSTHALRPGLDVELGARVEHDRPVDRDTLQQTYADVRSRLLCSAAAVSPRLAERLADGDVTGYVTLGWFAVNPSYAARPDNSGRALLRYAAHSELSVWKHHMALGVDTTFFTDRRQSNAVRPSEVDLTGELTARYAPFELHVAYETDRPIDRGGRSQSLLYAIFAYGFDFHDQLHPHHQK